MIAMNLKQKFKLKTIEKTSFFIHADGCNVQVRRGFAQVWRSDSFERMVISGLSRNFGPRLPSPRSPFLVLGSPFLVSRFSFLVFRSPSSFLVPRSSFLVPRSQFSVLSSSFSVPRSPLPSLSSPFPAPRFSIFVARSLFFVGVTFYYYCYDTTVVSSNSDFRNIIVPWAFL